ncbi:hypothetical protein [Leptospira adleri]|uniref:hypothetical protein n=1 Tax=Leptospira adleri TaxID=2023186 RepID=UPI00108360D4|nr:hypothetical protein [Leptospira adleri]TGM53457.1 hypothetical protein EHQ97_16410 [Leptospira adleri]
MNSKIKTFRAVRSFLFFGTAIFSFACSFFYDRGPYLFPPIDVEYFTCNRCNSYFGGIMGKGPTKSFKSEAAKKCIHRWEKIEAKNFSKNVELYYQEDLNSDPLFRKLMELHPN